MVHWVVTYRDVAHLITLNWAKVEKKYAKSFDAGLSNVFRMYIQRQNYAIEWDNV